MASDSKPQKSRAGLCVRWTFTITIAAVAAAIVLFPTWIASPPFDTLQLLFRYFIYPLLTDQPLAAGLPRLTGAYFVIVTPVVVTIAIVFYRHVSRVVPPATYLGRAAKVFALIVLVNCILNSQVQGGLGIPFALVYAGVLLALWWEAQQRFGGRRVVELLVWAGLGALISSGIVLPLLELETRFAFQRLHGVYGYLWMPAVGAYLIDHIMRYEAKRETTARNWGYLAAGLLSAAALTGLARLHGGGETYASGLWPHVIAGLAAVIGIATHVGNSWKKRGLGFQVRSDHGSGRFLLGCLLGGALLPLVAVPILIARQSQAGAMVQDEARETALLAVPDMDRTATGPNGGRLAESLVSERHAASSCGRFGGCHVDIHEQWQRSAHRLAANPAYRRTVRLLIEQRGVEQARLCAGCHDPIPLLAGRITDASTYPEEDSEGVTCVVCHSMVPGAENNNGHYRVEPSALFNTSVRDPFTAYMMIELYRDEHRSDLLGEQLTDNSICGPCHNLRSAHLILRETFDEWEHGPLGPDQPDARTCTDCHMPSSGDSYLGSFEFHDHRMAGSNVALAGLRGETPTAERDFIAASLELELSVSAAAAGGYAITAQLSSKDNGHSFPTAPRDLLDYWFEIRFEGPGAETEWQRLDDVGLFQARLLSRTGEVLTRHEIWLADREEGPEPIPPGESHRYVFPLPSPPPNTQRVALRLMHRRYQQPFLAFLGDRKGELYTDPIEILRRTLDWRS